MKKIVIAAACAAFACAVMPATAKSARAIENYNYMRAEDVAPVTLSASDFIAYYSQSPLGEAERAFLAENSDFSLNYSSAIASSYVTADYDDAAKELTVSAREYSYRAVNGKTVLWKPRSVGDFPFTKEGEDYLYQKSGIGESDGDTVSVTYQTSVNVDFHDVNGFLNAAYFAGKSASEKLAAERARYDAELAAYQTDRAGYLNYLAEMEQYRADKEKYDAYIAAYRIWKPKKDAYDAYLRDCEQYERDKLAYEEYVRLLAQYNEDMSRYQAYLAERRQYEDAMAKYEQESNSPEVQTALYQISVLNYMTTPITSLNRTVSGAILGNSVTQVLAEKEALTTVGGVDGAAVDRADASTRALRNLLTTYNACKTDEERYAFYIGCKSELSKQFNELLRALDYIYHGYSIVRNKIRDMKRTEQFEILLSQLYYLCNALDDAPVQNYVAKYKPRRPASGLAAADFDASYRIGNNKRTPAAIVGQDGVLEDKNNSEPLAGGYPNIPQEPSAPTEVPQPTQPEQKRNPIEPQPVEQPGEGPVAVDEPTMPEVVVEPTEPVAYVPTQNERTLSGAYESGEFVYRPPLTEDFVLPLQTQVTKYFRNARLVTLRFYERQDAEKPVYTVADVPLASFVEYPYAYPKKSRTGYDCVFSGWQDDEGNLIDLNCLTTNKGDLSLYPYFVETPKQYALIWQVDGVYFTDKCAFESVPTYNIEKFGAPKKERAGVRLYRFTGWQRGETFYPSDAALPQMQAEDVQYTAVFEESFVVTWSVGGASRSIPVWDGEVPDCGAVPTRGDDAVYHYTFLGWDKDIVAAHEDVTYTAQFQTDYLIGYRGGGGTVTAEDHFYVANCLSASARKYTSRFLFARAASEHMGVVIKLSSATLTFPLDSVALIAEQNIESLTVDIVRTSPYHYRFSILAADTVGLSALGHIRVNVVASGTFDRENSYLYNGEGEELRVTFQENTVSFDLAIGETYCLIPQYFLSAITSEHLSFSLSSERAEEGDVIEITALSEVPAGMYLERYYAVMNDGTEIPVENGTFTMPRGSVSVGVLCGYCQYTVTFKAEGKVIATRTYRYGDEIVPPASPVKAPDEVNRYEFSGWDRELEPVTADAEYNAQFTATPLPPVEHTVTRITRLLHIAYVAVPVFLVLLTTLIVFLVVRKVKKKRKKKSE